MRVCIYRYSRVTWSQYRKMISDTSNHHIPNNTPTTTTTTSSTTSFLLEATEARDDGLMQRSRDEYDARVCKLNRPQETK